MNPLPIFRFFLRLPSLAFRIAGLVRITNRARRSFKKVLRKEGLPEDVAEELERHFTPRFPSLLKR
ncbi:hypothetical protein [Thermococcus gammatolerans]|uniref:Uncharacterized protein n=1 Tax=Thermococcus gammatolerans (strain DSM 15229 / JCM 11827 / EJ3) TaxID=593117 RepID=C5A775_THEGJ|nr:hypothetical protein [Thermococcus gammatolerans]ACS34087.1 Conserved hypothetical protein [Thermococcus gammatolerans EJ3]